jgi:tetratricopeptide (TPR) repeat protein
MKRYLLIGLLTLSIATPAWAQRGRGGGGGGNSGGRSGFSGGNRGGFSGGGSRGAMVRPPSSTPSFSGARPQFRSPGSAVRPNVPSMQGVRPPIQSSPGIGSRLGDSVTRQYTRPIQPGGGAVRPDFNRIDRSIGSRPNVGFDPRMNAGIDRRSNVDWNRSGSRAPWDRSAGGDWNNGRNNNWNNNNWNKGDWNTGSWNNNNWNKGSWNNNYWNNGYGHHGRYGDWRGGDWYSRYHDHHNHWHNGWWGAWGLGYLPWFWGGGGGWGWGADVAYYNPYYVQTTLLPAPIDYSLPLPPPDTTPVAAEQSVETPLDPTAAEATALFDQGRAAYGLGDYPTALARVDEAIRKLPSDAALHEFRGLTLFAMQRYADAAAAIYAVLAVGPGWNWATVSALYPDPNQYTNQLRALEAFVTNNPSDAASRFLLSYHYIVIGSKSAAADQLREVTRLSPTDAVSAELLKSLTTPIDT